jgi:hypothetical protein
MKTKTSERETCPGCGRPFEKLDDDFDRDGVRRLAGERLCVGCWLARRQIEMEGQEPRFNWAMFLLVGAGLLLTVGVALKVWSGL